MIQKLTLLALVITISGCASNAPEWLTGSDRCASIGCGKDLEFYPMAPGEAVRQAQANGFRWGQTSSAFPPSDPRHHELKAKEEAAGETPWHWNQTSK